MRTVLPFPNPGSVIHLRSMKTDFYADSKINPEELTFLSSKITPKVMIFSYIENNALLCPLFLEMDYDALSLELPSFPNRMNFSDDESYYEYADFLCIFLNELGKKDVLIYFPEEKYTEIVLFLICAYFLRDETITIQELVTYFFEESPELEAIFSELDEMRTFLYKEYYIKYLDKKHLSQGSLRKQLLAAKEKLAKKTISSVRVELLSSENSLPYELNLSSLAEKVTSTASSHRDELSFNISSLTPKEFQPETEEPKELLENLMEMADTFDPDQFVGTEDVMSLDEIQEEEPIEKVPFITVTQIPKPPVRKTSVTAEDWDSALSFDLPDPEIPLESFLDDTESSLPKSAPKPKPIRKNFLGLPEDW
jgi:hypothetical protein